MNGLYCGIDLGMRSSAICIMNKEKEIIREWSCKNGDIKEELREYCKDIICLLEACPLAESICKEIEMMGGKAEIVDPKSTKGILHGRKKTDKVDANVLAHLAFLGWYKAVYRKNGKSRQIRTILKLRNTVVKMCDITQECD